MSVVTWGNSTNGGSSGSVDNDLMGVTQIFSTYGAFAALKSDGSVVTWGYSSYGGNSSSVTSQLTSGVVSFADPFNDDRLVPLSTTPTITLAVSPSSVAEDGTSNLIYTFTRTGVISNSLTVNYTIEGTATNGSDYTNIGTSVTFVAGSSTATVTVDPTSDTTVENDETVILTLASGTGYTIGTSSGVTGTITNSGFSSTGVISQSYIAGATIFFDTNFNYKWDEGEVKTISDEYGAFVLELPDSIDTNRNHIIDITEGQLVARDGFDTSSGLLFGALTALPNSTILTPLTSVQAKLVQDGLTAEEANNLLTQQLGLDSTLVLENFDPLEAVGQQKQVGLDTYLIHIQVQALSLLDGFQIVTKSNNLLNTIYGFAQFLKHRSLKTTIPFDFTSEAEIRAFLDFLLQAQNLKTTAEKLDAIAQIVAAGNQLLLEVSKVGGSKSTTEALPALASVKRVVQGSSIELIQQLIKGQKSPQQSLIAAQEFLNQNFTFVDSDLNAFGNRTIQIKALARRIDETNGQSEFEIQLSQQAPNQGLKILYSLSGTATLGADYQIDSKTMGELYIAPGETSAKISISTIDDQIAEPVETITINLKSVGEGYLIDPTSPVALIRIQDNETAIVDQVIKGITLEGTIGDDSFIAADGNDKLGGSYGNDFFDAKGGDDIVNGGYGDDILLGGEGDDWITGGHGNDNLEGNAGNDQIDGGSGNDYLQGGEGADILNGGMGNDTIEGNGGNDQIDGGDGNDILLGNEDNDWLTGQVGNDILIGGTGDDILNGGEGADVFYFSSKSEGFDTILDFNPEQGDKIQVSKSGFAVNNLDGFRFISGVLDFQGQNLALIQNDGRTYSYFPNLSDIIQLVETPTVTVSTEAKTIETQLIVSANLTEQTTLTKFATIPVNSGEPTVTTSANPDNLLAEIQQRGYIRFSGGRSDSISGVFDYQFVRAIAAAIFGDANRVDQVPGTFSESFSQVANKQVDLSTRHITQNLVRDGELNVDFGPVYYYDFLSVLVRNKSGIQGAKDLNGKKIGVVKNTTALTNLDNLLDSIGVQFTAEVFDTQNDLYAAYNLGEVDAIASDKGIIYDALEREILENKQEHRFLDIQFSKEPIGLVIPENESEWGDVVRWVVYTTIQAEEYGINSQNIDRLLADNTDDNSKNDSDPAIRRFLGLEGSLGSALELPQDFVVQVIKQVGNYGEIYQRSFPSLTRDLNLLSLTGGLLESLPFSGRSFDQELVNNDQRNLLAEIQNRGFIKYGLPQITGSGFPGFAEIDSQGQYKGFDVDLSKAIAAAVFGDPSKVEYTQQAFANSFANTANGLVDVSAAGYTGNLMRDAGLGVDYSPVYIHTGQGILTRKDSGITGIATLNGSTIGALTTVTAIENLSDLTKKFGSTIIITPFDDKNKMYAAYEKGEIDAVYNDKTLLAGIIPTLSDPQAHEILPETFSKEPLTLILDENQSDWADVVRWVMNSLVQAEEYGITSTNIDDIIAKNRDNDPNNNSIKEIQAFLGLQGNPGASLGLSSDFVVKMIKAVGNYGEIYARNFDTNILPREKNDLYHFSGLQYALPLGSLNQPPSFTGPDIFSIDENTRLVGIISTKDPEQDAITFALGGVDYSLFAINPSTGELTFNTAPNFEIRLDQDKNHLYQLQVIANDTKNNQVSQNISIRVTDVNESPIAEDDRLTLTEVTTQMIDPLQNDRDPDLNDQLKIISKTDGQYGRVDIRDNQLVYTLLDAYQSYAGNDIFTYTISDAKGLNATGSVNVMVKEKTIKPNSVVSNPFITINSSSPLIPTEAGTQSGIVDQISFRVPVNYNPAQIKEVLQNNVSQTSAAFNNIFGLYEIDDSTGRVNNILPGQLGYAEAALSKVVTNFAVRAGGSGNTVNGDVIVNGGKTYAPFVIANGGNYSGSIQQAINEFFQVNPNNSAATAQNYTTFPVAYFSFGVANPDGAAHIKNFGNNVFGFEDLPAGVGVSDYDFNDMLFSFG
ncbi:transporter substrate-binding domain-containing protein [Cylindrospermopsis raciborskii DSH]